MIIVFYIILESFLHYIGELVIDQVVGYNTPIQIYHLIKGELVTHQVLTNEYLKDASSI